MNYVADFVKGISRLKVVQGQIYNANSRSFMKVKMANLSTDLQSC